MIVPDYKSRNKKKKEYKSLFISTEEIKTSLNKQYNIFHYIAPKIKNENKIFDLINLLGNKTEFLKEKELYDKEKRKINRQIFTHKDNREDKINFNSVNINKFDKSKMYLDMPQLTIEEMFMVELIKFINKRKQLIEIKKEEEEKKQKLLHLKSLSQDDLLSKFSTENTKKKILSTNSQFNIMKRNYNNIHYISPSLSSKSIKNFEYKDNIPPNQTIKASLFSKNHTKLNRNKKFLSCKDFLVKIKNINLLLKNNISSPNKTNFNSSPNLKVNNSGESNNYSQITNNSKNKNEKIKINKKVDKNDNTNVFKELYYNIFKEENKIIKKTNEISGNLLDLKYNKYINNLNIYSNVLESKSKKKENKSLLIKHKKNNYKKIAENFTHYKKGLYNYPQVNKYIYGSRNPSKVFGGFKNMTIKIKKRNIKSS